MKKIILIFIIIFFVLSPLAIYGAFYWFELRNTKIIKKCDSEAYTSTLNYASEIFPSKTISDAEFHSLYEFNYKRCLRIHGLKE